MRIGKKKFVALPLNLEKSRKLEQAQENERLEMLGKAG